MKAEDKKEELKSTATKNIRRGLYMFFLGITRLFVEAWLCQEVWNKVIVEKTEAGTMGYWDMFFVMIAIRVMMGQIKIQPLTFGKQKENNIKE